MSFTLALACALVSALGYGIASVMQASAARRAEMRPNLDPMLLVRLAGDATYVASLGLDLLGFIASVVALRTLPLFMVQSAIAGSVGVTAIAASIAFGVRLERYERAALLGLLLGFALLALSARPGHAATLGTAGRSVLVGGVVVVALIGIASSRASDRKAGIGLALASGLSFAGTGVAARDLVVPHNAWHLVTHPEALAIVLYALLGVLLFATALQRTSVTAVAALVFLVETVVPSTIGLVFLGDHARPRLAVVAVLGFVVTIAASITLARRSEPLPREPSAPS